MKNLTLRFSLCVLFTGLLFHASAADKKIVLVAGRPSHGPGYHEFNAGCQLLKKCLDGVPGINAVFVPGGWPKDPGTF